MIKTIVTCLCFAIVIFVLFEVCSSDEGSTQEQTAYVTGASHIDLEWKWLFSEAVKTCANTFRAVLKIMDDYEKPGEANPVYYSQSQALAYQSMEESYPDIFSGIAQRVEDGHWEIVGGMWVESDANLPGGESFVRQIFYGKRYFQQKFGVDVKIGWLPDSFGYNGNLPQFFARSGIEDFFYFKTNWNDTHKPTIHDFWWQAPDGSRVFAHLAWGQYNNTVVPWTLKDLLEKAGEADPDQPGILYPIGMGDHGGGIGRFNIDTAVALANNGWPIHFGPAADFYNAVNLDKIENVIADELYLENHRGTYTSRAKHKQEVRALEYGLMAAEAIWTRAGLDDNEFPYDDLYEAWQALMLSEFHDTMAGSCIEPVYTKDVAERHKIAFDIIDTQITDAVDKLTGLENASSTFTDPGWFVVYNPLGFSLTAPVLVPVPKDQAQSLIVVDIDGTEMPCQLDADGGGIWFMAKDIPAYGWSVYQLQPGTPSGGAPYPADPGKLENAYLSLNLDSKSGLLTSVSAKALDSREFVQEGQGANLLQIYKDGPIHYDAWDIGFDKYTDAPIEILDKAEDISLIETGPVRSVIRITRQGEVENYIQDVILYYDLPRVDFVTQVLGWGQKAHRFLKAAFPLNLNNDAKTVTAEMPYGSITRVLDGHVAYTEFPGHKWADIEENFADSTAIGPGAAVISKEKYGYDVANDGIGEGLSDGRCNILRLSLLKSGTSPLYLYPDSGGPVTDRGDFTIHYALYPHAGDAQSANLMKTGNEFYAPFVIRFIRGTQPPELPSLVLVAPENALALWLKKPQDNPQPDEFIIRIIESERKSVTAQIHSMDYAIVSAQGVNLMEQPEDRKISWADPSTIRFPLGVGEIASIKLSFGPKEEEEDDDSGELPYTPTSLKPVESSAKTNCCGC